MPILFHFFYFLKKLSSKKTALISNHTLATIFLLAIAFTCLLSCSIDCESAKVGTVNFKANTENFIGYTDGQKITFVDGQNQTLVFSVKKTTGISTLCTKFLCKGFNDPFGSAPCEYVETPWINVELRSEDQTKLLTLGLYIDVFKSETMLFYDALSASYSDDANFASGHYGVEPHFSTPVFDRSLLPFADAMSLQSSYTLNNKVYESVYISQTNGNKIFVQAISGIIGFEIGGQLYTLK